MREGNMKYEAGNKETRQATGNRTKSHTHFSHVPLSLNAKITVDIQKYILGVTMFSICWYSLSIFRNSNNISNYYSSNWPFPEFLWNWQQRIVSGDTYSAVTITAMWARKEERLARHLHKY
jgi:hypothetical protein